MKPGFRRQEDEPEYEPAPEGDWVGGPDMIGVGHVGALTEDSDCDHEVGFGPHIYLRLKVGPFELVVGRPE